jgi:hypothetical protein
MTITAVQPFSLEKFLQLPETKPVQEFIEGKIIVKPCRKEDIVACSMKFVMQLIK